MRLSQAEHFANLRAPGFWADSMNKMNNNKQLPDMAQRYKN